MTITRPRWAVLAGALALTVQPALARPAATPTLTALPATAASHPYLTAAERLASFGYVEEEFILSGKANGYQWQGPARRIGVVAGPGDYATRVLVWRPRDPRKFGGNVEVSVLNASGAVDAGRPTDFARMVAQGDVWIGVTTKAVAARALQRFDPQRYAGLNWSNPAPAAARCPNPSIIPAYMSGPSAGSAASRFSYPETEDGLVWDMLGQLGQVLKSPQRSQLLPGFARPWLYLAGVSQSSLIVRTFAIAFHDRYRMPNGRPVYDGYFGVVGPALLRLNQCEADVPLRDPRQKFAALDVPYVSISSEGEMWLDAYTRQPDRLTPRGGWVNYEVAGGSHGSGEVPGVASPIAFGASPQDLARAMGPRAAAPAGAAMPNILPPGTRTNNLPWAPFARGAWHNLQLWVRSGALPPRAQPIAVDASFAVRRDAEGNALGGLRPPYLEVPTAAHTGSLSAGGMGGVMGARRPFTAAELGRLYPTPAAYRARFNAAADRLAAGRFISREDAEAMKRAAAKGPVGE